MGLLSLCSSKVPSTPRHSSVNFGHFSHNSISTTRKTQPSPGAPSVTFCQVPALVSVTSSDFSCRAQPCPLCCSLSPSSGQDRAGAPCLPAAPGEQFWPGGGTSLPAGVGQKSLVGWGGEKMLQNSRKTVFLKKNEWHLPFTCKSCQGQYAQQEQLWAVAQNQTHRAVLSLLCQEGVTVHYLLGVP